MFGLTRREIKPESTVSVADALSTRPIIWLIVSHKYYTRTQPQPPSILAGGGPRLIATIQAIAVVVVDGRPGNGLVAAQAREQTVCWNVELPENQAGQC